MFGMVFVLFTLGIAYGRDSAYDQAAGTSGDSWRAEQHSTSSGNYNALDSSWERARREASQGFDTGRSNNLSGGVQYIPIPKPKIDNNLSK